MFKMKKKIFLYLKTFYIPDIDIQSNPQIRLRFRLRFIEKQFMNLKAFRFIYINLSPEFIAYIF